MNFSKQDYRNAHADHEAWLAAQNQQAAEAAVSIGELLVQDADDAEIEADITKRNSVVKVGYKLKYRDRAAEQGQKRKAAKRSTWDWLAQSIAGECLGKKDKIDIARFLALLERNGVDHSRWTNRNKGWEGRLRMTGRLALQRVVAESGVLQVDGDTLEAPAEWVAKYKN